MRASLLLAGVLLTLGACTSDGPDVDVPHDEGAVVREIPAPGPEALEPAALDKQFTVVEGVWYLSSGDLPRITMPTGNGLLYPGGRKGLWISVPGLYGKWPVRLELRLEAPPVEDWCEDVVEVPYAHEGDEISMGSFESWSRSLPLPAGDYRVRLCATGLDAASREPEFDGKRYHVYSSRHLVQVWPAPPAAGEVLRTGSRWAAREHAAVSG